MTMESQGTSKKSLPLHGKATPKLDVDIEAEMRAYEESERERLGIKKDRAQWVDNMLKPEMKKSERKNVTLLVSGLTAAQDFLVEGALRGIGYNVKYFGISTNDGL